MTRFRTLVTTVVALLVCSTGAAHAAVAIRDDATGDAPAAIDIKQAQYSYGDGRVRVVSAVPDLGRYGRAELAISRFEVFEAGYVVRIVKKVGEAPTVRLLYYDHFSLKRRACEGVGGRWRDRSIALRVPVSCLRDHATPRIFVQLSTQRGDRIDRAPAVKRLARD